MPPRRTRMTRAETGVVSLSRREFFEEYFDYKDGQCVTALAPYGGGKTQILFDALEQAANPKRQAVILVMKPKDTTVTAYVQRHGYEIVRDWPPSTVSFMRRVVGKKPPGWALWPRETGDPDYDDAMQERIFRRCLRERYNAAKKKPNIVVADEVYSLEKELGLTTELRRSWTKGRFGNGLWAASQRAAYISAWAYQAQHLFLGFDPDKRSQDRYAEIGAGNDPDQITAILNSLGRFEFLYVSREERWMCIVEAS